MPTLLDNPAGADTRIPRGWGPVVGGRHRPPIRRLALLLAALLALPVIVGGLAGMWGMSRVERLAVDGLGGGGPYHVLVVGSDSRAELSKQEQRDLHTGSAEGHRTDTIFVLTIEGGKAAMLAFPRDLLVTRCDGSTGRINAAESIGGPSCLVETVERTSGIGIDNYVAINFGGFVDLVDAVGGVEMCLAKPIKDRDAGIDLPAGCQVLTGPDALGYVRVRKIDDDLHRIARQQEFIRALAGEIMSASTLLNPFRLFSVAGAGGAAVSTDSDLGPLDALRLARGLRAMQAGNVVTDTVPTTFANVSGAEVLRPTADAATVYSAHADGSILDQASTAIAPADVAVLVRNGTSVPGLAARVAAELTDAGITVTGTNNADPAARTHLRHPPSLQRHAELLAQLAPTPVELVEDRDATQLVLILGPDADAG